MALQTDDLSARRVSQDGPLMTRGGPVFRIPQMSWAEGDREREAERIPSSPPDAAPTSHH